MWWPFGKRSESRASDIDVGAVYSAFFGFAGGSYAFQISPAVLASSLTSPGGLDSVVTECRRITRISPLLLSYRRNILRHVVCEKPEPPMFSEVVPERTAAAAADLWLRHHDVDEERDCLGRVVTDGEFLVLVSDDTEFSIVPADGYTPETSGPEWRKEVVGFKLGKGSAVRRPGVSLIYVGERVTGEERAVPWVGGALPFAAALVAIRVSASHGLSALARIAAVIESTHPDRQAAQPAGRSGVIPTGGDRSVANPEQPITSLGVGSVPFMKLHEQVKRIQAGPDEQARKYEAELERDVAAALNIPLVELRGDFSTGGSFSNLRMAWTDAQAEYADRRAWWHRNFRIPRWRRILDAAWMAGDLPRMSREVLAALRAPTWKGPTPPAPAPEKDALTAKLLVEADIITAEQAEQLARVSQ